MEWEPKFCIPTYLLAESALGVVGSAFHEESNVIAGDGLFDEVVHAAGCGGVYFSLTLEVTVGTIREERS